jgi:hypothetical protein
MTYNASSRYKSALGEKKMALTGNLKFLSLRKVRTIAEPGRIQYERAGRDAD